MLDSKKKICILYVFYFYITIVFYFILEVAFQFVFIFV